MSLRLEFVSLARQEGANVRALFVHYGISPKTAYKWLARFEAAQGDPSSLSDRDRRPHASPRRSAPALEEAIVELRRHHPAWGGRKIAQRLLDLGHGQVAPSTVTTILHRHALISAAATEQARPWQRFEHAQPNSLWQIDFKGQFPTLAGPCHALTLLDDHSRFSLALHASCSTAGSRVQAQLQCVFERYGLPLRINADNGPPWGSSKEPATGLTQLTVWLIRLGIRVSHSRSYHPQTNGKVERFHASLQREVLKDRRFADLAQVQTAFDRWRDVYNCERPHEALDLSCPVQRYSPSPLALPASLAPIRYPEGAEVAVVGTSGFVRLAGQRTRVSQALAGLPIAATPDPHQDGLLQLHFCHHRFGTLDLRQATATD